MLTAFERSDTTAAVIVAFFVLVAVVAVVLLSLVARVRRADWWGNAQYLAEKQREEPADAPGGGS